MKVIVDENNYITDWCIQGQLANGIEVEPPEDQSVLYTAKFNFFKIVPILSEVQQDEDGNDIIDEEISYSLYFDQDAYESYMIEKLKTEKIKFIDSYKHIARIEFPYGNTGGVQRFTSDDINAINLSIKGIEAGVYSSIRWKYSNDTYEDADIEYLNGMLLKGGYLYNRCFDIEYLVVEEIKAITSYDDLLAYKEKDRFDELFFEEGDE